MLSIFQFKIYNGILFEFELSRCDGELVVNTALKV